MDTNEQLVRDTWEEVTAGPDIYGYGITLPTRPRHSLIGYEKKSDAWKDAAEFTRQRQEKIRRLERWKNLVREQSFLPAENHLEWSSLFQHIQKDLIDLQRGMKPAQEVKR